MFNKYKKILTIKWLLLFILAVAASGLCVRLGYWQLDRLRQKKEFINHYSIVSEAAPLKLNDNSNEVFQVNLDYRKVVVTGIFDNENSNVLRNQYHDGIPGYFLLTPLKISENLGVIIERGWIPSNGNGKPENWKQYYLNGPVKISGIIRVGNKSPEIVGAGQNNNTTSANPFFINDINTDALSTDLNYKILPIFIQPEISAGSESIPPIPYQPEIDLSEGPHFGYALQWFTFAIIIVIGTPIFVLKQIKEV